MTPRSRETDHVLNLIQSVVTEGCITQLTVAEIQQTAETQETLLFITGLDFSLINFDVTLTTVLSAQAIRVEVTECGWWKPMETEEKAWTQVWGMGGGFPRGKVESMIHI